MESLEIKMTRVEDGVVALHGKFDELKKFHMAHYGTTQQHKEKFIKLETNNWWLKSISACAFAVALAALKLAIH